MTNNDLSILIVDDMRFSRAVLKTSLKEAGYTDIRTTDSGLHALDLVRERKADVVLSNWTMPEMTGIELAMQLRDVDELNNHYTAIILFTAKEGNAPLIEAFQKGVDDYIRIPVDSQELVGRVYAAGRLAQLQNSLLRKSKTLNENHKKELTSLNFIDPVTGLGNQRYLHVRLGDMLKNVEEEYGGLSLAMLQIPLEEIQDLEDNVVNNILEQMAKRLKDATRNEDVVAHLGAGRFAVVLYRNKPEPFEYAVFDRILNILKKQFTSLENSIVNLHPLLGACHYQQKIGNITVDSIVKCALESLEKAHKEDLQVYLRIME